MKNNKDKIANLKLEISSDITDQERNLINEYWEMNDKLGFVHSFRSVESKYEWKKAEILNIINLNATIFFDGYCSFCQSFKSLEVKKRADFKNLFRDIKNISYPYKCKSCTEEMRKNHEKEEELKIQKENEYNEIVQVKAIEDKAWLELSLFDQKILKSCVDFNDFENLKRYYKGKFSEQNYPNLFESMRALGKKSLLKLTFYDFYELRIENYEFHPDLKKINFKTEKNSVARGNNVENQPIHSSIKDELKFKLTIDTRSHHPDKPRFGGTVKFPKDILFKEGIKYAFGAWERVNNDFYLTFIPVERTTNSPIQKRVTQEPKHIQNIIDRIFKY